MNTELNNIWIPIMDKLDSCINVSPYHIGGFEFIRLKILLINDKYYL
jgi:hypothetical protein